MNEWQKLKNIFSTVSHISHIDLENTKTWSIHWRSFIECFRDRESKSVPEDKKDKEDRESKSVPEDKKDKEDMESKSVPEVPEDKEDRESKSVPEAKDNKKDNKNELR